jgi:hypothetical protein
MTLSKETKRVKQLKKIIKKIEKCKKSISVCENKLSKLEPNDFEGLHEFYTNRLDCKKYHGSHLENRYQKILTN